VRILRGALELDPTHPAAGNNLAHTLTLQNRLDEAREQYRLTLGTAPELLEAHEGLASVCFRLGRLKEAVHHLHQVLLLDGESCGVNTALANALFQDGQLDQARAAGERALTLDPGVSGPYSVLALVHIVRKEFAPAIAFLEAGFERTRADSLLGMLTHLLQRVCDWGKWGKAWQQLAARLDQSTDIGSPYWLLTADTTAEQQLAYTRRWVEASFSTPQTTTEPPRRITLDSTRRVRVGYLSSDLHEHATTHLLAGVLEHHDRERFEIFAYSHGPEDGSAARKRVKKACEHFFDVAWEPDDVLVRRIQNDAIDILVDLKGYTVGARTGILARRPCPVQINWLGYPGTMGAGFMDYLIADDFIVPPGSQSAYAERVLHLAPGWQCNDRSRPLMEPLSRTEYGLPQAGFVFCCFNQAVKITPSVFASWMSLLRRTPQSVLWLAEDNTLATHNLIAAAKAHGIDPQRLVFAPRLPYDQHLARYRVADLALDTFPYTSHTTASDALWLGCPLVALCGATFAARVSGSILRACGLPELVTDSLADYESLAYRFAVDPDFATNMRARLASARLTSPLFDAAVYARNLERLYLELVTKISR
jgi:predicted O-linked N-acetylglucosamine transferase (SPINDLY family)